jgi:hypothetical protein
MLSCGESFAGEQRLERRPVGLRGATAEVLDEESTHWFNCNGCRLPVSGCRLSNYRQLTTDNWQLTTDN